MKKTARMIILAMLCAASYSACQRASEEKQGERVLSVDSLNQSFSLLNDSLDYRWKVIMADEDQKLEDMKRLLQEISYTPRYNTERLRNLQAKLEEVYKMRFQPENMTSEQIDKFDSASLAVQQEIIQFAEDHPDIEKFPLMGKLIDSIQAADQRMLFLRVEYDNYARDYNHFLEGNREYVRKIDTVGLHKQRTLFQIGE